MASYNTAHEDDWDNDNGSHGQTFYNSRGRTYPQKNYPRNNEGFRNRGSSPRDNNYGSKENTNTDGPRGTRPFRKDGNSSTNSHRIELYVPERNLGLIIGKKGSKIKELQEQTNTKIVVNQGQYNENNEVSIVVSGNDLSNCERAKLLILKISPRQENQPRGETRNNQSRDDAHNKSTNDAYNRSANDAYNRSANDYNERENSDSPEPKEEPKKEQKKNWKDLYDDYLNNEKKKWLKTPKVVKDFYVEDRSVASMSKEEVNQLRLGNNNIVVESLAGMTEKDALDLELQVALKPEDDVIANPVRAFAEAFGRYPDIMREIKRADFEKPSPIQMQAWPIILQGRDLIGIAQTGTGKTLAFLLPAFIHIEGQPTPRENRNGPTVLIITPTRELALQIENEVKKYRYHGITCVCVYGGASRRDQIELVNKGVEIVVATPGRLNDLVSNNILVMDHVSYVVLDEADRMLDLGFEPEINKALYKVKPGRQTIMTSATWPSNVRRLAFKYMRDPIQIFVGSLDLTAVHSVEQRISLVEESEKYKELKSFLVQELVGDTKVIVFMTRKATVDNVSSSLAIEGYYNCASITGDREQCDREEAIADIKSGYSKVLIATDVASRGIDIKDITHVINYDFPRNIEEYVHRIGRTGRAGRMGVAITYFTRDDWRHASELIKIMEEASQHVPDELHKMAQRYADKKDRRTQEKSSGGGGGGRRGGGRGRDSQFVHWRTSEQDHCLAHDSTFCPDFPFCC